MVYDSYDYLIVNNHAVVIVFRSDKHFIGQKASQHMVLITSVELLFVLKFNVSLEQFRLHILR